MFLKLRTIFVCVLVFGCSLYSNIQIAAAQETAQITSPVPGSTLSTSDVRFEWDAVDGARRYWIFIGTFRGSNNLFSQSRGLATFADVTNIALWGKPIHVRLWTMGADGRWRSADFVYETIDEGNGPQKAELTLPAAGTTLTTSQVTFEWTAGNDITQYLLYVGSFPGHTNLARHNAGTNTSVTLDLPLSGRPIHVRLWSKTVQGVWEFNDYIFDTVNLDGSAKHAILTPTPGSMINQATVTFTYGNGNNVDRAYLYVGTSLGGSDIYRGFINNGSQEITFFPDGNTVYVRLWSFIHGVWEYNDYQYGTVDLGVEPQPAEITSPAPGTILPTSNVTFEWSQGEDVSRRYLFVGTQLGRRDIAFGDQTTNTSYTANIPRNVHKIYVRLWSQIFGIWESQDYEYDMLTGPIQVSGTIDTDTTWYQRGSPYIVTDNITVNPDVTLTIEPGVEVKFDGFFGIDDHGTIHAVGAYKQPIIFTSNQATPAVGDWDRLTLRTVGTILDHVVIEYADRGVYVPSFAGNPIIVQNSTIRNNNDGIYFEPQTAMHILDNTIIDNNNGIYAFCNQFTGCAPLINNNAILNNTSNNIFVTGNGSATVINAKRNWWGTLDQSTIESTLHHQPDDGAQALIDFFPYLDGPQGNPIGGPIEAEINIVEPYFDPHNGETTRIDFTISPSVTVDVAIYDNETDALFKVLATNQFIPADTASFIWDGTDQLGQIPLSGNFYVQFDVETLSGQTATFTTKDNLITVAPLVSVFFSDHVVTHRFFKPSEHTITDISYTTNIDADITLKIYDDQDNVVRTLVNAQPRAAGANVESWDGLNDSGQLLADGVYRYSLEALAADGGIGTYALVHDPDVLPQPTLSNVTITPENSFSPLKDGPLTIEYTTDLPSIVSIGFENVAFVTKEPKEAGTYTALWDGFTSTGLANFFQDAFNVDAVAAPMPESYIVLEATEPTTLMINLAQVDPYTFRPIYSEITTLSYMINEEADVTIRVLSPDSMTVIDTLVDNVNHPAGTYNVMWDGRTSAEETVIEENVYRMRIEATDTSGRTVTRDVGIRIQF